MAGVQVAVVGAGVTGLFVAHALGALGVGDVTVYERTGIAAGASGVQPGGIRQQWGTAVNCRARPRVALVLPRRAGAARDAGRPALSGVRLPLPRPLDRGAGTARRERRAPERARRPVAARRAGRSGTARAGARPSSTVTGAAWCAEDGYLDHPQAVLQALGERADVVQRRGRPPRAATLAAGSSPSRTGRARRRRTSSSRPAGSPGR